MRCPFCNNLDTQVKDSRQSDDGSSIKRRRFCNMCDARFTTFERVQLRELIVIKKNGERKPFDRDKIFRSVNIAVRKRPVSHETVELITNNIVRFLEIYGESEIPSTLIGEKIMEALAKIDKVAYVRFASVYKNFAETGDFEKFITDIDYTNS